MLVIVIAQCGLKSSGKRWHDQLQDVLRSMGFTPSKAEEDIWMQPMGDHYKHIVVHVDNLMIVSKKPKAIIHDLEVTNKFKLKGTGPTAYHLGCNHWRDEDGTLCTGLTTCITKMVAEHEGLYGSKPRFVHQFPLEKNNCPELDTTPILDEDGIIQCQSLIGTLQWGITLVRFDVATAVMTMSKFQAAPRQGHLERVKLTCSHLCKHGTGCVRVQAGKPDLSDIPVPD